VSERELLIYILDKIALAIKQLEKAKDEIMVYFDTIEGDTNDTEDNHR